MVTQAISVVLDHKRDRVSGHPEHLRCLYLWVRVQYVLGQTAETFAMWCYQLKPCNPAISQKRNSLYSISGRRTRVASAGTLSSRSVEHKKSDILPVTSIRPQGGTYLVPLGRPVQTIRKYLFVGYPVLTLRYRVCAEGIDDGDFLAISPEIAIPHVSSRFVPFPHDTFQ
jgi:hypothetical protein